MFRILFLIVAVLVSGCRFGNKVVTQSNPDIYTGYYESAPQTLQFCVTLESTPNQVCQDIPQASVNNYVPDLIYQVMSNPLAFVVKNWESGDSYIFSPFGGTSLLPLFLNKQNLNVSVLANNDPPPPLWGHTECTHGFSLLANGTLKPGASKNVNGLSTNGHLEIEYVVLDEFDGTCGAATTEMQNCYFDHLTCGGSNETENLSLQESVRNFFLPYVAASVIAPNQINDVRGLGYRVFYQ